MDNSLGKKPLLILALAVFFLHTLVTGGHLMSPDEELMARTAEAMAFRGTTMILPLEANLATGELPRGMDPSAAFATRLGREPGMFHAQYLPLQPLLSVPVIWLGKALEPSFAEPFAARLWPTMPTRYLDDLPAGERAAGLFRRGLLVMLFNPLVAAISAVLLARLATLLTGLRAAGLLSASLWAFGTIAWPHSRTYFTEPLAGLFAILAFDQAIRWLMSPPERRMRHAIIAGVSLALANLTRVDSPFLTVGIVLAMLGGGVWRYMREESMGNTSRRLPFADIGVCGAIALGGWIGLQLFNKLRFGVDLTSGYGDQAEGVKFTTPLLIGLHGLLMSPGKGLFFFSPAAIIGLVGWCTQWNRRRWLCWMVLAAYTPFFIAMAMWQNWDGGWCWGPRHVVQVHLPLMLGAAFLLETHLGPLRRIAIAVVALAGIAVQLYGSSQNPLDFYQEFFLNYRDRVFYTTNMTGLQVSHVDAAFELQRIDPSGESVPVGVASFPAPMIDSLYLPQHTQWAGYRRMWTLGYRDWYWWNLMHGTPSIDPLREGP